MLPLLVILRVSNGAHKTNKQKGKHHSAGHTTVTHWNQAEYSLTVLVSDVSPAFLGLHWQLTTCQELTVITMTTDGIDVQGWAVMKACRMQ